MERERLRVRPERFVAGGEALARDADGRVGFVRGAVPGDDVTVAIEQRSKDWWRGEVIERHTAGPDHVEPPCPARRAGCGGCDWQHVVVARQLAHKAEIVTEALRRTARLGEPRVDIGGAVDPLGYRTTVRVVGDHTGRPAFRRERSTETVSAAGCLVAHPAIVALLEQITLPAGSELTLRVSRATGEMTARWDRRLGRVDGLPDSVAVGPGAVLHEVVAGQRLRVSAASFFQSGPAAAELLVGAVRRAAPELELAGRVLDAYSGVGMLARCVTGAGAELVAVESSKPAASDCRVNLSGRRATIERCEFGRWQAPPAGGFEVAIADPARPGLGRPGVAALTRAGAPVVVLVSCDPVALARDAVLLAGAGYAFERCEVLDLFAHTHHVEVVTRFVHDPTTADRNRSASSPGTLGA